MQNLSSYEENLKRLRSKPHMTARTRSSGRPTSSSPLRSAPGKTAYQWIALRPLSWKNRCQCHWRNPRDGADLPSCPRHLLRFSNAQRLQSNFSNQHLWDVPGKLHDLNKNLPKLRQPGPRTPRSRREPAAPQSSQPVSGISIATQPKQTSTNLGGGMWRPDY